MKPLGRIFRAGVTALLLAVITVPYGAVELSVRAAVDGDRLVRALESGLAPSNIGYPSRIIGVSELGRGGLAVSFWAQRASDPDGMAAGVLADAWSIFTIAFPAAGFPVDIAVHAIFPVEDPEGNVSARVVGHFRVGAGTFRRLLEENAGPAQLLDEADVAMLSLEGLTWH